MTNGDPAKSTTRCEPVKCVLVGIVAADVPAKEPALVQAIAFSQAHEAALTIYVLAPDSPEALAMSGEHAKEAERSQKLARSTAHLASEAASQAGLEVVTDHFRSTPEQSSERFAQLARVHDVAILEAVSGMDSMRRRVVEDVLFDSGRPLILVPRNGGPAAPQRIMVAWDGSARAARAVKDALPLLAGAATVIAATVEGERDLSRMAPGADLATYLARHGIDCGLATLAAGRQDAAARLRLFAGEEGFEMIVMGAYVHSRFRQAILGGVTQSLLESPPALLFLAH